MDTQPREITSFSEIIDSYDNFIFDCDGVLWRGDHRIDSGFDTLNKLKQLNKNIYFITNHSARSRKQFHEKFIHLGYEGDIENVYPLSAVGPQYIKLKYPGVKKIFAIGMEGLFEEIKAAGFEAVGSLEDSHRVLKDEEEFLNMKIEDNVNAVLLGFDIGFNYYKMAYASVCIQRGAHFFAISAEPYDHVGDRRYPGGGAIVEAVKSASNTEPIFLGKPNRYVIDVIIDKNKLDRKRTLMIGDRLNTDVLLGKNGGVDTCLVFSGVTSRDLAAHEFKLDKSIIPNYIAEKVAP